MRIKIDQKYWKLIFTRLKRNLLGECDPPDKRGKEIRISKHIKDGKLEFDTTVHELLHAADWYKSEAWVDRTASEIATVLWNLGYRKYLGHDEV